MSDSNSNDPKNPKPPSNEDLLEAMRKVLEHPKMKAIENEPGFRETEQLLLKTRSASEFGAQAVDEIQNAAMNRLLGKAKQLGEDGFGAIAQRRGPTRRELVGIIKMMTLAELALILEKNRQDPTLAYDALIDGAVELAAIRAEGASIEESDLAHLQETKSEEIKGAIFGQAPAKA